MRALTFKVVILIIICTADFCASARARGQLKTGRRPIEPKGGSIAISQERVKLLQDALSWLTLRYNGALLNEQQNQPYLDLLLEKYKTSKYYRTLVIAFQHGVLPKLTLDAGANCRPEYTLNFKNPFNQSVTDFSIKNFTFQSYYARNNPHKMGASAFCDYRKGLRCNTTTKKCECPSGSKMSPVSGGGGGRGVTRSTHQACLLKKEEICALIDLEHFDHHNILKHYLPSMIFNLEKPLGCQNALRCRLGVDDYEYPKCHGEESSDEYDMGDNRYDYGRKCTLHLYTDNYSGMCKKGLTCFNFGPRSHPEKPGNSEKQGYCAMEQGEFIGTGAGKRQIIQNDTLIDIQPFVIPFVNSRTTSWSSIEHHGTLRNYMGALQEANSKYFIMTQGNVGGVCSVERTRKMGELWEFYVKLEQKPPSGSHFVATEDELNLKLVDLNNLVKGKGKICRVNKNVDTPGGLPDNIGPALKCVSSGSPADSDGNDGTCAESPSASTTAAAHRLQEFLEYENKVRDALASEEQRYDQNILGDFPEAGCSPRVGHAEPIMAGKSRHHQIDVLEGGKCPDGSVCYENLDDRRGIYAEPTCQFIDSYVPTPSCHSVDENRSWFGKCEKEILKIRVMEALAGVHDHSHLGRGDTCQHDIEQTIKQAILEQIDIQNPYSILSMINVGKAKGGFCDPTRLLECSKDDKCKCLENTKPRITEEGFTSDYCYLTKGSCKSDVKKLLPISAIQKEMMKKHYGSLPEIEESCKNGNICMFVETSKKMCTSVNTGKTGYEGDPRMERNKVDNDKDKDNKSGASEILGKLSRYPKIILFIISLPLFT